MTTTFHRSRRVMHGAARCIAVCLLFSVPAVSSRKPQTPADRVTVAVEIAAPVNVDVLTAESPVRFDQRPVLTMLSASMSGLQAYDAYSTLTALKRGGVESNPLMQGIVGHPAVFIGVKAGLTAASIYAAERLWREHHRGTAIALMAVTNGIMAAVAVNNASVLHASR